jgi:carbon storage regulator CsrA
MLVLSRRDKQNVVITVGDVEIVVHVIEAKNGVVRLGFQAPHDAVIARAELRTDDVS